MPRTRLQALVLASLLALAGCAATGISGTETGTTPGPTATEPSTATPAGEPRVTARFTVNNGDDEAYDVSLYVVQNQSRSDGLFPLQVTLRNGTTRIYDRDEPPFIPGDIWSDVVRLEPASGTLVAVHQRLPPRSTLRLDVRNVPADAKSMDVRYDTDQPRSPLAGFGQASQVCTGSDADVTTFNESHSSSSSCGSVSDVRFPDSLIRRSVAANNASEST